MAADTFVVVQLLFSSSCHNAHFLVAFLVVLRMCLSSSQSCPSPSEHTVSAAKQQRNFFILSLIPKHAIQVTFSLSVCSNSVLDS